MNKRKLDAPIGPISSSAPSGSSLSRNPAAPTTPKGPHGQHTSLPPRPSPATVAASGDGVPKIPRTDRQSQALHYLKGNSAPQSLPVPNVAALKSEEPSFNAPLSARADGSALHSAKKVRTDERGANGGDRGRINSRSDLVPVARSLNLLGAAGTKGKAPEVPLPRLEESTAAPSLLSRLAGQPGGPGAASTTDRNQSQTEKDRRQNRRSKREPNGEQEKERPKSLTTSIVPAKRPVETSTLGVVTAFTAPSDLTSIPRRDLSLADSDKDPVVGFSIRGAAKAAHAASTVEGNRGVGSLLERLQATEGVGAELGGRRRKRTKHS